MDSSLTITFKIHVKLNQRSLDIVNQAKEKRPFKTKQNKTKQNKTKQNKTKQNKTKQNKTKQNKTKRTFEVKIKKDTFI